MATTRSNGRDSRCRGAMSARTLIRSQVRFSLKHDATTRTTARPVLYAGLTKPIYTRTRVPGMRSIALFAGVAGS